MVQAKGKRRQSSGRGSGTGSRRGTTSIGTSGDGWTSRCSSGCTGGEDRRHRDTMEKTANSTTAIATYTVHRYASDALALRSAANNKTKKKAGRKQRDRLTDGKKWGSKRKRGRDVAQGATEHRDAAADAHGHTADDNRRDKTTRSDPLRPCSAPAPRNELPAPQFAQHCAALVRVPGAEIAA